jgi:hypothetical protein
MQDSHHHSPFNHRRDSDPIYNLPLSEFTKQWNSYLKSKERKSKERKSKERKSKERKSNERKANERKKDQADFKGEKIGSEREIKDWKTACEHWSRRIWSSKNIETRREYVYRTMTHKFPEFYEKEAPLSQNMVSTLFKAYDEHFFNHALARLLVDLKLKLDFKVSTKLTSVAGTCSIDTRQCHYTITMSSMFDKLFKNGEKSLTNGGLRCTDRISCLQLTFEHELVHFLQGVLCPAFNQPHGKTFKAIVLAMFGHTQTKHGLLSGDAEIHEKKMTERKNTINDARNLVLATVKVGQVVTVVDPKYGTWSGSVIKRPTARSVRIALKPLFEFQKNLPDRFQQGLNVPLVWIKTSAGKAEVL